MGYENSSKQHTVIFPDENSGVRCQLIGTLGNLLWLAQIQLPEVNFP